MDSNAIELTITAQKIAETLAIGRSTLNKYSRSLEEAGYIFIKDERGNRAYMERDIVALRHAISLLGKGVLYDKAMADAASKYVRTSIAMGSTESTETSVVSTNKDNNSAMLSMRQELTAEIVNAVNHATESLHEENAELRSILKETLIRLDEMNSQKTIAAGIDNQRDERERLRDEKLTEVLREIRETKQQANKPFWQRLFGEK